MTTREAALSTLDALDALDSIILALDTLEDIYGTDSCPVTLRCQTGDAQ